MISLERQVEAAISRMGDLGIFSTLTGLQPLIVIAHGAHRDVQQPVAPQFLGRCIAVGIVAGQRIETERDGSIIIWPTIRLNAIYGLTDASLRICDVTKPASDWSPKEASDLLYAKAQLKG